MSLSSTAPLDVTSRSGAVRSLERLSVREPGFARTADSAACRELIRGGSRSFFMASLLLPESVREGAYALYGFCRLSDDEVDVEGGSHGAVDRLRARLDRIYAGAPSTAPVDRALADTVAQFGVPRAALDALLDGLAWDAEGRECESLSDVLAYGARVAGSVGAMMAALMGAGTPNLVARACDLGVAMQLTNIARDVGADARLGRIYLPRAWLREAGIDPQAWLAAPAFTPALGGCVARLLAEADALYARADAGISALPPAFRPAILSARLLYAEIGREVERNGLDSVSRRAKVSYARKAALLGLAIRRAGRSDRRAQGALEAPPLAETRFLVEAAVAARVPVTAPRRRAMEADLAWTLDLFATLERRARRQVAAR